MLRQPEGGDTETFEPGFELGAVRRGHFDAGRRDRFESGLLADRGSTRKREQQ
jgi:hypothetical protein